jgi:hypothetical protein
MGIYQVASWIRLALKQIFQLYFEKPKLLQREVFTKVAFISEFEKLVSRETERGLLMSFPFLVYNCSHHFVKKKQVISDKMAVEILSKIQQMNILLD